MTLQENRMAVSETILEMRQEQRDHRIAELEESYYNLTEENTDWLQGMDQCEALEQLEEAINEKDLTVLEQNEYYRKRWAHDKAVEEYEDSL